MKWFFLLSVLWLGSPLRAGDISVNATPGALQTAFDTGKIKAGDTVTLATGHHGGLVLNGATFAPPVTIRAKAGTDVTLTHLHLTDVAGLTLRGLRIRPETAPMGPGALIEIGNGREITLERMIVESAQDTSHWTRADWQARAWHGLQASGQTITVTDSVLRNIRHGMELDVAGARIISNTIDTFSGDGIRGLGDESHYTGNIIRTCVKVDDHHDDGFQSWSRDSTGAPGRGVVRNVTLSGNRIENGAHPFACELQGIGLFDGIYEDWRIDGNIVVVNHWHGITVMGARRVHVTGNTVVDARPGRPGPPWVTITAHKDGRPPEDSALEHNITQPWAGGNNTRFGQTQPGVRTIGNRVAPTPHAALRMAQERD